MAGQLVFVTLLPGTVAISVAGCGGSKAAPDPPKIVTPAGTTTLTVTAKSGSLTPSEYSASADSAVRRLHKKGRGSVPYGNSVINPD